MNYLSQTYEGKHHDKKIADEENPTYPEDIGVYQDTGFQGYAPDGVKTFQPQKKPKGKELTPTTTLQCVDQICTRRIEVFRLQATEVSDLLHIRNPLC